jgi:hypothetical protein
MMGSSPGGCTETLNARRVDNDKSAGLQTGTVDQQSIAARASVEVLGPDGTDLASLIESVSTSNVQTEN